MRMCSALMIETNNEENKFVSDKQGEGVDYCEGYQKEKKFPPVAR